MNKLTVTIEPMTRDKMPEKFRFWFNRAYRISGKIDDKEFSINVTPNFTIDGLIKDLREKGIII